MMSASVGGRNRVREVDRVDALGLFDRRAQRCRLRARSHTHRRVQVGVLERLRSRKPGQFRAATARLPDL